MAISLKNHDDRITALENKFSNRIKVLYENTEIIEKHDDVNLGWQYVNRTINVKTDNNFSHVIMLGCVTEGGLMITDIDILNKLPLGKRFTLFRTNNYMFDPSCFVTVNNVNDFTFIFDCQSSPSPCQRSYPYKILLVNWK